MDFELALWQAVHLSLPDAVRRGCGFHWAQAVDRKVKEIGLATAYRQDAGTRTFIRRLLALPFLPSEHIHDTFYELSSRASTTALQSLCDYIEDQWIDHPTFTPRRWSVFNKSIRTNNDVEG